MTDDMHSKKVQMFEITNRLKQKLGIDGRDKEGEIPEKKIHEAQAFIHELCRNSRQNIEANLAEISALWDEMKDSVNERLREITSTQIFTLAHEVRDIGALCGYDLAGYFAGSLGDFIEHTKLDMEAQRVIIQAHVDALVVVVKKDMRDDEGKQAEELKAMVKIAVERYS